MYIKKKTKGRSTIATNVAEVKKSRKLSNSLTTLANSPDLAVFEAKFIFINWSKIRRDILESAFFPALSIKLALKVFIKKCED